MEECAEVIGANTKKQITEELADLLEVVDAIRKELDVSEMDLDETKTIKQCEKGGFYDGCVLEQIDYRYDRYVCGVAFKDHTVYLQHERDHGHRGTRFASQIL